MFFFYSETSFFSIKKIYIFLWYPVKKNRGTFFLFTINVTYNNFNIRIHNLLNLHAGFIFFFLSIHWVHKFNLLS